MICEQCWKVQDILKYTCSGLGVCFVRVWDEPFRFLASQQNSILKRMAHRRFFLMLLLDTQIVTSVNKTNAVKIYWLIKKLSALKVAISRNVPFLDDFTLINKLNQKWIHKLKLCLLIEFQHLYLGKTHRFVRISSHLKSWNEPKITRAGYFRVRITFGFFL